MPLGRPPRSFANGCERDRRAPLIGRSLSRLEEAPFQRKPDKGSKIRCARFKMAARWWIDFGSWTLELGIGYAVECPDHSRQVQGNPHGAGSRPSHRRGL